ncbi:hypothetical protein BFJ72_g9892 [Fusarium proliferatum]|uniref:Telomere length regulation protein conserved domain-containing protein n=1 Tax=Gibberella intermedia TaxID=948311 RepID=A0A420SWQ2_GIBIN|nr:hypothetical protein BFJ72_g9892 [Fusarium proliferatum]
MDDLLTPVSTTYLKPRNEPEPLFTEVKPASTASTQKKPPSISDKSTADEIIDALKSQPDYDTLISILDFLNNPKSASSNFSFSTPSPKSASIIHLLVSEIASNYWTLLLEGDIEDDTKGKTELPRDADLFLGCLRSLTGLNAVITQLRVLIQESRLGGKEERRADLSINTGILLSILSSILGSAQSISTIWSTSIKGISSVAMQRVQCQKLVSILSNSQIVSIAAEALEVMGRDKVDDGVHWIADGLKYSTWMGNAIVSWVHSSPEPDGMAFAYTHPDDKVSAVAGLLMEVALNDETKRDVLISWCASSSGAGVGDGVGIRRAVVAALARDREAITTVLEKSIAQFGDELYIRHSAMLQQDAHTQILLLAAGYVHRVSPMKLTLLMRLGTYMNTISNRIGSTQPRAQFLGLVVGESLSALIDDKKQRLDFKMEQTETEEAQQLKNLTKVSDPVGPIDPILFDHAIETVPQKRKPSTPSEALQKKAKQKKKPVVSEPKPKAIIEEIESSEEDDDLAPYSKDSDPEDSNDDATLVQRNKPKPPVYIRDLISYFRDSESYDKQLLSLQTAPILIRRKANYGTEVSFHADELAGLLVGIQDKFEIENFDDLRLHSMLALVVSQPKTMAPWFARTFFEGDYSLHQRTSILVTLGLSARELAGFEVSQYQSAAAFPSKRLPEKMEQLYIGSGNDSSSLLSSQLKALPSTALENISQSLTSSFLAPLAAEAADANTGPDILKLQSFTARYKSKSSSKPRMRAIPNTTAALLATSFFSPLTAHFQVALRSAKPIILNHALLALYLQTLGVVVHAAGPSTLSLPQLTAELWDLLLGVRVHVFGDLGAMKGWLVAMASLLEVNGGDMRRLCETQGREVIETREWVAMVFEKTRGEDGGEENEVKMLAAGVLIRLGEAIERYQALLMGDLVGFQ